MPNKKQTVDVPVFFSIHVPLVQAYLGIKKWKAHQRKCKQCATAKPTPWDYDTKCPVGRELLGPLEED